MPHKNTAENLLDRVVTQLGYEVIHTHDQLVLISENQFILHRTETPYMVDVYFNEALEEHAAEELMARIQAAGLENSLIISYKGAYGMVENEDASFSIEFFDLTPDE